MNSRTRLFLVTISLWVAVVVALGYWRMFYAWRLGAFYSFFVHYMPILGLVLLIVVISEFFYFDRRLSNGD